MQLSRNFTLEELTATTTGFLNRPDSDEINRLAELALHILQPIRERWGRIRITSGFRSPSVNSAVGGVSTSQHCFGEAADFAPLDAPIDEVFSWIVKDSGLQFGQCINERRGERRWVHVSLPGDGRRIMEALVYDGKSYARFVG
ncbi:MAG: peptidase M15 [Deltaproteobacteria bacterium]|nr:peptidase M15 [Deltaproteobacteria bacterium]